MGGAIRSYNIVCLTKIASFLGGFLKGEGCDEEVIGGCHMFPPSAITHIALGYGSAFWISNYFWRRGTEATTHTHSRAFDVIKETGIAS